MEPVLKSVNSRIALCTMQVFIFSKVNSIIDVLSQWLLPNVKHLLEKNLKNRSSRNSTHHQDLHFLHPSMLEGFRLVVCLDDRQYIIPKWLRLKGHNQDYISWRGIFNMSKSWRVVGWAVPMEPISFLCWHDSSTLVFAVEESCHTLQIRHTIP